MKSSINTTTKGVRTMVLPAQSKADFERGFRGLNGLSDADAKNMNKKELVDKCLSPVAIKTWDGQDLPGNQRGSNSASVLVNFAKMSNIYDEQIGGEYKNPKGISYTGAANGKPVSVEAIENVSDQNPETRVSYRTTIDPFALASANVEERKASDKGAFVRKGDENRLTLNYSFPSTSDGVAAVSAEGFAANVGKGATQRYILTASANNKDVPADKTINEVGKLFADNFGKALKDAADGKKVGDLTRKDPETGKATKETIQGSGVSKLDFASVKEIELEKGVKAYALIPNDGKVDNDFTSKSNKWLAEFNNRFNKEMSQVVNATYPDKDKDAMGRQIGNMTGVNAYAVRPQAQDGKYNGMVLVQPAVTATVQPFVTSLLKSYDAATHSKDLPARAGMTRDELQANPVALSDIYRDSELLANMKALGEKYNATPEKSEAEKQASIAKQAEKLDKIADAIGYEPEAQAQLGE